MIKKNMQIYFKEEEEENNPSSVAEELKRHASAQGTVIVQANQHSKKHVKHEAMLDVVL